MVVVGYGGGLTSLESRNIDVHTTAPPPALDDLPIVPISFSSLMSHSLSPKKP
jgi:hypothetical protein